MIVVKNEAMEEAVLPTKEVTFFDKEGAYMLFATADHERSRGIGDGQTMLDRHFFEVVIAYLYVYMH